MGPKLSSALIAACLVVASVGVVKASPQKNPPNPASAAGAKGGPPPRVAHGPDAALLQPYEDRITALESAIREEQDQIKRVRQTTKGPDAKARVAPLEQRIKSLRDEIKIVRDEMHEARKAGKGKPAPPNGSKPKPAKPAKGG
jgi:hypothetical protein